MNATIPLTRVAQMRPVFEQGRSGDGQAHAALRKGALKLLDFMLRLKS